MLHHTHDSHSDTKPRCSYCGEAPVNHTLFRCANFISSRFDSHIVRMTSFAPRFLKNFADRIPVALFNTLVFFKKAHFSSDITKVASYRSEIIWQEAQARDIHMEQIIIGDRPLDWYRARINGKIIYFESIPLLPQFLDFKKDWDDKTVLKKELSKQGIPVPAYAKLPLFGFETVHHIFERFTKPVIVKPRIGSRARHTVTNIHTFEEFKKAIAVARQISLDLVVEEHINGYICRATIVDGVLAGFYRGSTPSIVGDGESTVRQLIDKKDAQALDPRDHVQQKAEFSDHIARAGFAIDDILPKDTILTLSHRAGRFYGGTTKEMIDELHPSFVPILEKAAGIVGLAVAGFDCLIPDPTSPADSQKWGIIECNTLPFIDVHYFATEGTPRNIAGMVWDMWNKK